MSKTSKANAQPNTAPVRLIHVDDIHVGKRLRALDTGEVDKVAASIMEVGQLAPIVVRKTPGSDKSYALVAGLHRLQAALSLGSSWGSQIQAAIHEPMAPAAAETMEITENLVRAELTKVERAKHTARLKELYEAAHPETKHGAAPGKAGGGKKAKGVKSTSFAKATAKATGRSKSSIEKAAKLGKLLDRINGTCLDVGEETAALAKLPEEERAALIERAVAGETVSAKAALKAKKKADAKPPAPVTGSAERPIDEAPTNDAPPDDDRSLAKKLFDAFNTALLLCLDENNWSHLSNKKDQDEFRSAMKRLQNLREVLPRLAMSKAVR